MKKAIELKKPYWFLVHRDVTFSRELFKKIEHPEDVKFKDKKFFDPLCLEMYDFVIQTGTPVEARTGNWVQPFFTFEDIATYLNTQFSDRNFVNHLMNKEKNNG